MGADLGSVDAAFGLGREAGRGEEGAPEEEETVRKQPRTVRAKKSESESEGRISAEKL